MDYARKARCGHWEYLEEVYNIPIEIELPKGTVYKLLGKELTWDDEPVELQTETEKKVNTVTGCSISFSPFTPAKTDMPVRYPLLFSNIRSYRFLRKYPFIPSGYAISFYIERSLARTLPRRFTHKAASCLFPFAVSPFLRPGTGRTAPH